MSMGVGSLELLTYRVLLETVIASTSLRTDPDEVRVRGQKSPSVFLLFWS